MSPDEIDKAAGELYERGFPWYVQYDYKDAEAFKKFQREHHVRDIAAILRKHFPPAEQPSEGKPAADVLDQVREQVGKMDSKAMRDVADGVWYDNDMQKCSQTADAIDALRSLLNPTVAESSTAEKGK